VGGKSDEGEKLVIKWRPTQQETGWEPCVEETTGQKFKCRGSIDKENI